jgi:hypothetical protein
MHKNVVVCFNLLGDLVFAISAIRLGTTRRFHHCLQIQPQLDAGAKVSASDLYKGITPPAGDSYSPETVLGLLDRWLGRNEIETLWIEGSDPSILTRLFGLYLNHWAPHADRILPINTVYLAPDISRGNPPDSISARTAYYGGLVKTFLDRLNMPTVNTVNWIYNRAVDTTEVEIDPDTEPVGDLSWSRER